MGRQLSAAQEKLQRLQQQQIAKRQAAEELLDSVRENFAITVKERNQTQAKVDLCEAQIREIEQKARAIVSFLISYFCRWPILKQLMQMKFQ